MLAWGGGAEILATFFGGEKKTCAQRPTSLGRRDFLPWEKAS